MSEKDSGKSDEAKPNPKKVAKKERHTETKLGYKLGEVASALQKEIRRGDEEAAVYWALLLQQKAAQYAWKRVLVTAAEDIGLAAPEVVSQVYSLALGWKMSKEGAWYVSPHALTMAVVLLSRARKSTEIEDLQSYTLELIKRGIRKEMPEYAKDMHTEAGKARGAMVDEWYDSRHLLFGIPVNAYTKKLAELVPAWFSPTLKEVLQVKKEEKQGGHEL